jgi:hypothetical protein
VGARACLLAPSGQGKILQIVSFLRTAVRMQIGLRRVLILAPAAKVLHWAAEFRRWTSEEGAEQRNTPPGLSGRGSLLSRRAVIVGCDHASRMLLRQWSLHSHALLIAAYEAFLPLSAEADEADAALLRLARPDIVVCDEAHALFAHDGAKDTPMRHWPHVWERTLRSAGRTIFVSGAPLLQRMRESHELVAALSSGLVPNDAEAFAKPFDSIRRVSVGSGEAQRASDAGNHYAALQCGTVPHCASPPEVLWSYCRRG